MALNSELRRSDRFVGDGTQAAFPFEFKVFTNDQVKALVAYDDGVETEINPSLYSVSLSADQDNNPGGTLTLLDPLPKGAALVILSAVPAFQPAVFTNRGGFYPATLNDSLDRLTILVQQLQEKAERALLVPVTEEKTPQQLMFEILEVAAKANEYAQQAQSILKAVQQSEQVVVESKAAVLEAKAYVDASQERVEQLVEVVEENREELDVFKQNIESFQVVVENKDAIQAIATDLQGFPIEEFDGGWTDEADQPMTAVGGVIRECAENIEAIKSIADALEGVMNLGDMEAELTEIGSTDYVTIDQTGVTGAR